MNSLFTLRITFILSFLIICQFSLKAQDNTNAKPQQDSIKVILVVTPEQNNSRPATRSRSTNYTAPTTSERAGKSTYKNPNIVHVKTPTAAYSAPTTAERTGAPTYMNTSEPAKVKAEPATYTSSSRPRRLNPAGSAPANASVRLNTPGAATQSVAVNKTIRLNGSTATQTTITVPVKRDTIYIKKTDTVTVKKTDTLTVTETVERKSNNNKILYGEIGGPGLALSVNYDTRFSGGRNGLGFRIGAGYYGNGGNTVFTVPFQINYLIGSGSNFIELGGGTTFLNSTGDNTGKTFIFDRVTGLIGTATIGYRYQPEKGKLNYRLDFVPIFYDEGIIWAGGLSVGYNF